jgi:hypothetical protein
MFKWKKTSFGARPFPVKNWKYLFARRETNFFLLFSLFCARERENDNNKRRRAKKEELFVVFFFRCCCCCCLREVLFRVFFFPRFSSVRIMRQREIRASDFVFI